MRTTDDLPNLKPPRRRRRVAFIGALRSSFLAGLVVVAPIGITFWLIWTLTGWIDGWVLPLVPYRWRPEHYIGIPLRGVGVLLFLAFTVLIGWMAKGWVGRSLIRSGEALVDRMPIVRSVYGGLKQIAETILSQNEARFEKACLVEYPRAGVWAVAFVAAPAKGEIAAVGDGRTLHAVFMPTTPNPTTGFLLYVPEDEIHFLDMSLEEAAKLVISAGLVYPAPNGAPVAPPPLAGQNSA